MNELNKQTEQPDLASASASGIARRRMILASLGKGATVAAAVAVPMNSLAAIGTLSVTANGRRCTISGTMSGVHSNETVRVICSGGSPSYYANNWPANGNSPIPIYGGVGNFSRDTLFNELFGSGSSAKLIDILNRTAGTAAEASWIAALLNGTIGTYGANHNFPYTAAQVIDFYKAGGTTAANALAFFQGYMETQMSALAPTSQGTTFFQQ